MKIKKIGIPFNIRKPVLAFGPQTKNTICFINGSAAYLSSVRSDLSSPEGFLSFEKDARRFLREEPDVIAYDLHPDYLSTRFASALSGDYRKTAVQHHHAHIASCMLDNNLKNKKVIGIAFDGTGLGTDNTLWGAEFILAGYNSFKRAAALKQIPLLGGERAIREPWRLAAAWLYSMYKDKFLGLRIEFAGKLNIKSWDVLRQMYLSGFNSPLASSMGRLFDAAAALVLGRMKVDFEAESAIQLEKTASAYNKQGRPRYSFAVRKEEGLYVLDPAPVFAGITADLEKKTDKREIAYGFHYAVAWAARRVCLSLRKDSGINCVVLSGGVFQNKLLLSLTKGLLYKEGFKVLCHSRVRPDDSGISLGQAAAACGEIR